MMSGRGLPRLGGLATMDPLLLQLKVQLGATLTVSDLGRDQVLGFTAGQWVELIDEVSELNGSSGSLYHIDGVSDSGADLRRYTARARLLRPVATPTSGWSGPSAFSRIARERA